MENSKKVRLQKILADRGFCSRREAEKWISEKKVKVNGKIAEIGEKFDPENSQIEISEKFIKKVSSEKIVIAFNKPIGIVTSTKKTSVEKKIVLDFFPSSFPRIFPIGRLDKNSSGLLLLTNDGELAFRLTHPKFEKAKIYRVKVRFPISEKKMEKIRSGGITILNSKILPARIWKITKNEFRIELKEGKNRHIRRLFRKFGNEVLLLHREKIGDLSLLDLKLESGKFKILSKQEILKLEKNSYFLTK